MSMRNTTNPFDYVNNINSGKPNMMRDTENDELAEEGYNPWLTNLAFSYYTDTILYANLLNMFPDLDKRPQYEFYKYGVRPKKRRASWIKSVDNDDLLMICDYYECNRTVGKQYMSLLSEENINAIRRTYNKGG